MILRGEIDFNRNTTYVTEPETPHYFLIVINDISINLPETQSSVSKFNNKHHKLDSLSITNLLLNKQLQLLRVDVFRDKKTAITYYDLIQESELTKRAFQNKHIT